MKQQIDRLTSLRNAFANAANFGILAGLATPATDFLDGKSPTIKV